MRTDTTSAYFSLVKGFGYLALTLMVLAIGYVSYLAVANWPGITV